MVEKWMTLKLVDGRNIAFRTERLSMLVEQDGRFFAWVQMPLEPEPSEFEIVSEVDFKTLADQIWQAEHE